MSFKAEVRYRNKKAALEAVRLDGLALRFASESLQKDEELVLEAVRLNAEAFQFAAEELRRDKQFAMQALNHMQCIEVQRISGKMDFWFVSKELWRDKEFVMEAVKWEHTFKYVAKELWGDKEVVLKALEWTGNALQFASEELRWNREIVLKAVKRNSESLQFAAKKFLGDKEVVLEAVKQRGYALFDATKELKADREVVLEAIKQNSSVFRYAANELKADREVVLEAIKQNSSVFRYAAKELRTDKHFILEAAMHDHKVLELAADEFGTTLEAAKGANVSGQAIECAAEELWWDQEFVQEAAKLRDPGVYILRKLFMDGEARADVVKLCGRTLGDEEVASSAAKPKVHALHYLVKELWAEKAFVFAALKRDPDVFRFAKGYQADRDMVLEAVRQQGVVLQFAAERYRADKEVVLEAIHCSGRGVLRYASEELQHDPDVCRARHRFHLVMDEFKAVIQKMAAASAPSKESPPEEEEIWFLPDTWEMHWDQGSGCVVFYDEMGAKVWRIEDTTAFRAKRNACVQAATPLDCLEFAGTVNLWAPVNVAVPPSTEAEKPMPSVAAAALAASKRAGVEAEAPKPASDARSPAASAGIGGRGAETPCRSLGLW